MMPFNPFPILRANLVRNPALTLVTWGLILLAVASGVAVISLERALRLGSARAADDFDIIIGAPGSPTQLVLSTVYLRPQAIPLVAPELLLEASQAPGSRYAAPIAFGDHWQGQPIIGTIAEFATRGSTLAMTEGRVFRQRGEAVVGAAVVLPLGARFSPQHGHAEEDGEDDDDDHAEDAHHAGTHYTVVGRMAPRHSVWDKAILVPVEDVWAVHSLPDGHGADASGAIGPPWQAGRLAGVPAIAVQPASVTAAYQLRGQFRNARSLAVFPAEVLNELYVVLGNVRDLVAGMALAMQVLVMLAVLTALLVGFLARRRQFAVLRAIGASRAYLFCTVWVEVTLLVSAGALAGLLLGHLAAQAIAVWAESKLGFPLPIDAGSEEMVLVAGLVILGALIALIPAALVFRRALHDELMT